MFGGADIAFLADGGCELDSVDTERVTVTFQRSGAVMFRGFPMDLDRFKRFTGRFTRHFVTEYNPLERRYIGDGTMTVQYYKEGIALHAEMAYLPVISETLRAPDILWFYCERPGRDGGETTLCDGVAVADALSPSTRTLLRTQRIKYRMVTGQDTWRAVSGLCNAEDACRMMLKVDGITSCVIDEKTSLRWEYATYAIRKTRSGDRDAFVNSIICMAPRFEDDSPIPTEVIDEIKQVTAGLTHRVSWRGGDLLMVDNTRFLHGRTSNDDQRSVYVRMSLASFPPS
jgi:alpha-ketoglutarate-dependent taurine dioxygenase